MNTLIESPNTDAAPALLDEEGVLEQEPDRAVGCLKLGAFCRSDGLSHQRPPYPAEETRNDFGSPPRVSGAPAGPGLPLEGEPDDSACVSAVLGGDIEVFEILVRRYQPRIFASARRYARRQSEVEDIVQEVFLRAFQNLKSFRGEAPFAHWLMRLAVRVCFTFLRGHRRSRETPFSDLSDPEQNWLDTFVREPDAAAESAAAARQLVARILEGLSPGARLLITLLEIEERSMKEVASLTGWSVPVIKVRAFRARAEMKRRLAASLREKYL